MTIREMENKRGKGIETFKEFYKSLKKGCYELKISTAKEMYKIYITPIHIRG